MIPHLYRMHCQYLIPSKSHSLSVCFLLFPLQTHQNHQNPGCLWQKTCWWYPLTKSPLVSSRLWIAVGMIWAKHLMQSGFPSASSKNQGRKSKKCVDNFSDDSDVTLISFISACHVPRIWNEWCDRNIKSDDVFICVYCMNQRHGKMKTGKTNGNTISWNRQMTSDNSDVANKESAWYNI